MAGLTLHLVPICVQTVCYPLPVAGIGVRVEPQQGLLVHDCSDRLAGHPWVSFPPSRQVHSSLLLSGRFLSSGEKEAKTPEAKYPESSHLYCPCYATFHNTNNQKLAAVHGGFCTQIKLRFSTTKREM